MHFFGENIYLALHWYQNLTIRIDKDAFINMRLVMWTFQKCQKVIFWDKSVESHFFSKIFWQMMVLDKRDISEAIGIQNFLLLQSYDKKLTMCTFYPINLYWIDFLKIWRYKDLQQVYTYVSCDKLQWLTLRFTITR